jgi:hypothetical protein
MSSDWLPHARDSQLAMASNWLTYLTADRRTAWGVPQARYNELATLHDDAAEILQKAKDDTQRTPVVTVQCQTAFDALSDAQRFIKGHYLLEPPLVDADVVALGLKLYNPPSPIPRPEAQPTADLAFPGIHLVELRNIRPVSGAPTGARRFRVTGVPTTGKDLPESLFTRRRRELFDFDGESANSTQLVAGVLALPKLPR